MLTAVMRQIGRLSNRKDEVQPMGPRLSVEALARARWGGSRLLSSGANCLCWPKTPFEVVRRALGLHGTPPVVVQSIEDRKRDKSPFVRPGSLGFDPLWNPLANPLVRPGRNKHEGL
jgi:hypothetical protein